MNHLLTNSRLLYRLEWLAITVALSWYLIAQVDWSQSRNIALVVFFAILPDIALFAFPAVRRGASWPYALYNALHNYVIWLLAAVVLHLLGFNLGVTILAWAIHIALDRTVGYALRDAGGVIQPAA
jgi:hypothetical protein